MFSLEQFIIYAYFFNGFFRLSFVFGVSSGMYVKFYFLALAAIVSFVLAGLILVKTLKTPGDKQTSLLLFAAIFSGAVSMLDMTIATYFYITSPSIFTFIPETMLILYRVFYVAFPLAALFFWLFFSRLVQVNRVIVYFFVIFALVVVFMNLIFATITAEEVQLVLSTSIDLVFEVILLIYWLSVASIITLSFYHYAAKQKGELRTKGLLFGTAGLSVLMAEVIGVIAIFSSNMILQESMWIVTAASFIFMYLGLFTPKLLLPKPKRK